MRRADVLIVLALAALGCGGSSGTNEVTADEACTDLAHARCTRLAACSMTAVQTRFGDAATCEAQEKLSCANALSAPSNGNTPTHDEACSQAVGTWACADFLDNTTPPPACQQQTGALAAGAPCAFPGQCQTGFCAIVPGSACGACAAAPTAGASCAELTTCGPGLTCTTDTQTCAVFAAAGGTCGAGQPCGAGLSCVGANATAGVKGKCQASATQVGATCDPTLKTGAGCDRNAGLVCNGQTKQCAAVVVAAGGQPCGSVNGQPQLCGAGTCIGASAGQPGTCVADASEGGACDLASGPDCVVLARCVLGSDGGTAGTCQINDASSCH